MENISDLEKVSNNLDKSISENQRVVEFNRSEIELLKSYIHQNKIVLRDIKKDSESVGKRYEIITIEKKDEYKSVKQLAIHYIYLVKNKKGLIDLSNLLTSSNKEWNRKLKVFKKDLSDLLKLIEFAKSRKIQTESQIEDIVFGRLKQKKRFGNRELEPALKPLIKKHKLVKGEELRNFQIEAICSDLEKEGYEVSNKSVATKLRSMGFKKEIH